MSKHRTFGWGRALGLLFVLWLLGVMLISWSENRHWTRALTCSQTLYRYADATRTPLTKDARWEIGACILYFNQPLAGDPS